MPKGSPHERDSRDETDQDKFPKFRGNQDLPSNAQGLPERAQDLYRESFNAAQDRFLVLLFYIRLREIRCYEQFYRSIDRFRIKNIFFKRVASRRVPCHPFLFYSPGFLNSSQF